MPVKSSGSADRPQSTAWPVPSCCVLDRDLDRPAQLVAKLGDRGRDPVAFMAQQDHRWCGATLATECSACDSMLRPASVCSTFGSVRPHAGAGPGRQDQDRGLAGALSIESPRASC